MFGRGRRTDLDETAPETIELVKRMRLEIAREFSRWTCTPHPSTQVAGNHRALKRKAKPYTGEDKHGNKLTVNGDDEDEDEDEDDEEEEGPTAEPTELEKEFPRRRFKGPWDTLAQLKLHEIFYNIPKWYVRNPLTFKTLTP
jgi:hypothetical protein